MLVTFQMPELKKKKKKDLCASNDPWHTQMQTQDSEFRQASSFVSYQLFLVSNVLPVRQRMISVGALF